MHISIKKQFFNIKIVKFATFLQENLLHIQLNLSHKFPGLLYRYYNAHQLYSLSGANILLP